MLKVLDVVLNAKSDRLANSIITLCFLFFFIGFFPVEVKAVVIKMAVVMPEKSTWTNTLHEFAAQVKKETKGEVVFKIYAGGISGDESDVLRKMRVNQLHAAGFSGVGLGYVLPEIRILETPLLFNTYQEVDLVKEKLFAFFSAAFEKKGYILLGFAEAGFVYFFSKKNIADEKTMKKIKMWVWKGDRVAKTFLSTFGIKYVPLHLTDVNTGLETGMLDSFYAPPLAAVAFQWYAKIRYMLDYPMVNSTGALLMNKRIFDKLSSKNQIILKKTAKKYAAQMVTLTRRDNITALEVLKEAGIKFVLPDKNQIAAFHNNALKTCEKNYSKLYSKELFEKIKKILTQYRALNSKEPEKQ